MRTLRKTLCLVLALVMVLGVCAVGASAVDFADADEINYAEAVAVLSGIGVINGIENEDGTYSFQPAGTLTRAQAAKIIAYLLNADESELSSKSTFTDCQGHWADGSIAYAAAKGIVAGVGDGNYNPDGKLTGFAFAKMLLCALGYNAENEGMVGETWTISVASLAKKTGLLKGIEKYDGNAECTREQACQMAYNALKADMVEYATSGTTITTGDVTITTGASAAAPTGETLYKDVFHLSDSNEENAGEIENKYDELGRECSLEIYDEKGNVIYNEYPEADYIYTNTSNGLQSKEDVAKAYAKAAGLKEADITILNWPGDSSDPDEPYPTYSPAPSFEPVYLSLMDYDETRPLWPDEIAEFTVSRDKKTLTFVTIYWYEYAAILDIKDTADKDADYTKDITLCDYDDMMIASISEDELAEIEYYSSWIVHDDELKVGEKGDWIACYCNWMNSAFDGEFNYGSAVVLKQNQGLITAANENERKITIGGKTYKLDYEFIDRDRVLSPVDFASTMNYYISPNGNLAVLFIDTPAEEEYETKIGYAISAQSVAYAAGAAGDLLGDGASAQNDGRAVIEILDMDGKVTVYDLAVKTDAKAGTTSFTGADSVYTGVVATSAKAAVDMFVEYYVNEDGTIVVTKEEAPASVSTVKATVAVGSDKANSATVIKTVGDAASKYATAEITGYKNFVDATYTTAYVTYTDAGYIDTIYAVNVPAAAPAPVAPVIAYCKTIGDLTAKGYEVTFVVDGKEVVYLDDNSIVSEGKYYELVVADGVVDTATAEATPTYDDAEISVVDAGYIDTDAGVIEFAKTTATYDISGKNITELAKGVYVDVFNLDDGSQIIFIVPALPTM